MTSEERSRNIINTIWYWLPSRWNNGTSWFEIAGVAVTGNETTGGATVSVSKDGASVVDVNFTNEELYGGAPLTPAAARERIEAV